MTVLPYNAADKMECMYRKQVNKLEQVALWYGWHDII